MKLLIELLSSFLLLRGGDPFKKKELIYLNYNNLIYNVECSQKATKIFAGTRLTHLLFADDCVIFDRVKSKEWQNLHNLLAVYERASDQCLNSQKTTIFFSSNIGRAERVLIQEVVGVKMSNNYEKYLGLCTMVGRSKYNSVRGINDRIWQKLNSWKDQLLSPTSKEVLLKAIIQAIPIYKMSIFRLSTKMCKEKASLIARF